MRRCFMAEVFMDNAKVMAKGQVTIPKRIRELLEIENGDHVTFVVDGESVKIVNTKIFIEDKVQGKE